MSRSVRLCAVVVSALLALVTLAGCGSDDAKDSGGSGGTATAPTKDSGASSGTATTPKKDSSGTKTINVTFKGDTVTPQGKSLEIKAGKPLKLHITADEPGEIHVHSSPEQEIEYSAGTTDKTITIDQPGVVDVESHHLEKLIFQLEVR